MAEETIDKKTMHWNNRVFLTFAATLIIGTNTGSVFVQQQAQNTEQIVYQTEAQKRRLAHAMEKHELEQKIIFLEFQLYESRQKNK